MANRRMTAIYLSDEEREYVDQIQEDYGLSSMASAIRLAIRLLANSRILEDSETVRVSEEDWQ